MDDRDMKIESLRRQLNEMNSRFSAMEQEIALLNNQIERLERRQKTAIKKE